DRPGPARPRAVLYASRGVLPSLVEQPRRGRASLYLGGPAHSAVRRRRDRRIGPARPPARPDQQERDVSSEKIQRVGVIGAGQMGAGIAEVCARAHVDVLVYEQTRELAAAGRARILRSLDRGVSSGKITEREREQAAWR